MYAAFQDLFSDACYAFQKPQQSSLASDFTERVKRESDVTMPVEIHHKLEGRSSRPPRTDSVNSESPSAVRATVPRSSQTKIPDRLPRAPASRPDGPVTHLASSNPRRTPPTVTSEGVRSNRGNRGRARVHQGSSSESQPSSTHVAAPTKKTTKKKIV